MTSKNKRLKLETTRANKSLKMFDARLKRKDLILFIKAFSSLLETFTVVLKAIKSIFTERYDRFVRFSGPIK